MGCDIHAYVERLPAHGEQWVIQSPPTTWDEWDWGNEWYVPRDYRLFGHLAGVRNYEVTPIVAPRGLPDDVSCEVKATATRWGVDGHTHSYLSVDELRGAGVLGKLVAVCEQYPGACRLVFWFDN